MAEQRHQRLTVGRGGCPSPKASAQTLQFDLLLPAGTISTISLSGPLRLARAPADASVFVQRWELAPVAGPSAGTGATPIWRFSPGTAVAKPLARVHVDGHERFRHSWCPLRRGMWDLYATYAGHAGALEASRSPCGGPRVLVTG